MTEKNPGSAGASAEPPHGRPSSDERADANAEQLLGVFKDLVGRLGKSRASAEEEEEANEQFEEAEKAFAEVARLLSVKPPRGFTSTGAK